jgi:hypothetical protein
MQRELASFAMSHGRGEPPEHVVAGLLGELFPEWREKGGEDVGLRPVGVAGTQTMQSVAETVGASEVVARVPTPLPGPAPAAASVTEARRSLRVPLGIAGAAVIAIAGLFALRAMRRDDSPAVAAPVAVPRAEPAPAPEPEPEPEPAPEPEPEPAPEPEHETPVPGHPEPKPKPKPVPATTDTGLLDLNAVPWAYVSIDGGAEEETPIRARKLSAGNHKVRIRNPVLERQRDMSIEISPGETSRYVVDLRQ